MHASPQAPSAPSCQPQRLVPRPQPSSLSARYTLTFTAFLIATSVACKSGGASLWWLLAVAEQKATLLLQRCASPAAARRAAVACRARTPADASPYCTTAPLYSVSSLCRLVGSVLASGPSGRATRAQGSAAGFNLIAPLTVRPDSECSGAARHAARRLKLLKPAHPTPLARRASHSTRRLCGERWRCLWP